MKSDRLPLSIVFVGAYPKVGQKPKGGVQTATLNLVRALWFSFGLRSTVLVPSDVESRLDTDWAQIVYLKIPRNALLRRWKIRKRVLRHPSLDSADIIHVQGDASLARAVDTGSHPVVLTIHGIAEEDVKLDGRPFASLRSLMLGFLEKRARKSARHVVAISDYTRTHVGRNVKVCHTIPNAIDPRFFEFTHDKHSFRNNLLYVGRVVPLKNVRGLIASFGTLAQSFPNSRLSIVGGGTENYLRLCKDDARRLGLEGRIEFLGEHDAKDLASLMSQSDCLVLPSLQENAPMVIAEAAAVGLHIIATRVGGVASMLDEYPRTTLIDPGNKEELTHAISEFLSYDDVDAEPTSSSAPAREDWASRYRPEVVARSTLLMYQEIVATYQRK